MTPLVDAPKDVFELIWDYTSKMKSWKFIKKQKGIYSIDIYPRKGAYNPQASLLLGFEVENNKKEIIHVYSHFSHRFFYKHGLAFIISIAAILCVPLLLAIILSPAIQTPTKIDVIARLISLLIFPLLLILLLSGASQHFATESRKTEVDYLLKQISKNPKVILHQNSPRKRIYRDIPLSIETEFVCPICGAVNKKNEIFCFQCGSQINENIFTDNR